MPGKKGNFTAQTRSMACRQARLEYVGDRHELFISASGYMKESTSECYSKEGGRISLLSNRRPWDEIIIYPEGGVGP